MARVLHVTECHGGGVSRAIDAITRLAPPGTEHFLLWAGDEQPDSARFSGVRPLPRGFLARVRAVREVANELGADVVHAHSSWAGVYSRIGKRPDAPVIYEPHCYKFDDPGGNPIARTVYRAVERFLHRRASAVVVLSPHERALATALGPGPRIAFLPNIPTVSIAPELRAVAPCVIMIGRIVAQKDPAFFVRVTERLRQDIPELEVVWIGDGTRRQRERLSSHGIRVTGWLGREEMDREMTRNGVYVHSARYEGFPLSVLDAAAAGYPVVARAIPAFEGTPVWVEHNPTDIAATCLALIQSEPASVQKASEARDLLLSEMSVPAQRAALASIYAPLLEAVQP